MDDHVPRRGSVADLIAPYRRVVVVGTTGAGKTTLARCLARCLGVPHVELDALHWEPNWKEAPTETFRARVADALYVDGWVVDGNYIKARDLIWPRAQLAIWLDYPLPLVLWQLFWRTARRIVTQEELFAGNRENWKTHLLTRDSLFLWAVTTHFRRHRQISDAVSYPQHAHIRLLHLRSPRQARRLMMSMSECGGRGPEQANCAPSSSSART